MMEKNVEPDCGGNYAGRSHAASPNHYAQSKTLPNDERNAEQGKKSRLSLTQHAFSPRASPRANYAAHERIDAKAPSREPDRHEEGYRRLRTRGHQDHGRNRKH